MEDMEALWRRIVFTILASNTDDHLRNHAILYEGQRLRGNTGVTPSAASVSSAAWTPAQEAGRGVRI
jgi:serine/threonine-protein kinase HipA